MSNTNILNIVCEACLPGYSFQDRTKTCNKINNCEKNGNWMNLCEKCSPNHGYFFNEFQSSISALLLDNCTKMVYKIKY